MLAARPADMSGISRNRSTKSCTPPAPPEAITGTWTISLTSRSISRSNPCFTPSVSIELTTTSPAPRSTPWRIHSRASRPVSTRPPFKNTWYVPSTRLASTDSTTHWSPYRLAAWPMSSGFLMAPELTDTLSAPQDSTRSKSSRLLMPPPTVRGMKMVEATAVRMSVNSFRPSKEAVIS